MKAKHAGTRKRVEKLITKWSALIGLDRFGTTIDHRFSEAYLDSDACCSAQTKQQWGYRSALVEWYLPCLAELTDAQVEVTVVHELAHVLLAPVQAKLDLEQHLDVLEFTTETVARALISVGGG